MIKTEHRIDQAEHAIGHKHDLLLIRKCSTCWKRNVPFDSEEDCPLAGDQHDRHDQENMLFLNTEEDVCIGQVGDCIIDREGYVILKQCRYVIIAHEQHLTGDRQENSFF